MTTDRVVVAYQLQMVASVNPDVLCDVTVVHPLGDHRESPSFKSVRDSNEAENVGMGKVSPHNNLSTKPLHRV